jgi:uncharacterized delta-60 repeat protein
MEDVRAICPDFAGGIVISYAGFVDVGYGLSMQSDGKILMAGSSDGRVALLRYNALGFLDTTFSENGIVTTGIGDNADGYSVISQPDGKILVSGSSDGDFALVRYNSDGTLDASFSDDGLLATDLGNKDFGWSVALQPDGKILVGGYSFNNGWGTYRNDFALVRYNVDGSLDTGFDNDGMVKTFTGMYAQAYSINMQSDGKILVAGGTNGDFCLVRYNVDGSLDADFSGDGIVTTDAGGFEEGYCMVLQADGKILVAGESNDDFALVRYHTDGSLDTDFSTDGMLVTDFGEDDDPRCMALQTDGKILVVGSSIGDDDSDIVLARYNSDGTLDTGFGDHGKIITDLGGYDSANGVVVQPDGRVIVAGSTIRNGNSDFALVCYTADGSLDMDFGNHAMDKTLPMVSAFRPADGASFLSIDRDIEVLFSEDIQRGIGTITIRSGSVDGLVVESYDAATSPNLSFAGPVLTITPSSDWSYETHYFVTFDSGTVKDLAGNSYAGSTNYDFTTGLGSTIYSMIRNGVSIEPAVYRGPAIAAEGKAIEFQYIGNDAGEVLVGTEFNDFINTTDGMDVIDAGVGNDVIDGGTGSNFLTGGAGTDIFFSDGRGGVTTWSTITDWQSGEQLSVWGWHPGTSKIIAWVQAGAPGYEGLTMHADLNGDNVIDTSVTFSGIVSQSQLPTPLQFDGVLWFV